MDIIQKLQNIIYREEKRAHVRTGSELATKLNQELAFNFGQADFLIFILLFKTVLCVLCRGANGTIASFSFELFSKFNQIIIGYSVRTLEPCIFRGLEAGTWVSVPVYSEHSAHL